MDQKNTSNQQNNVNYLKYTSYASALAGISTKFIIHPLDTLKNKIQIQTQKSHLKDLKRHLLLQKTKETFKNEGIRGFYKGVGISSLGSVPAFSLFMTTYEWTKKKISQDNNILSKNKFVMHMICGFNAELVSCILWLPIDVIKERLQVQQNIKLYNYKNSINAAYVIIQKEGILGLYTGFGATLVSFGTSIALHFAFYEKLKEFFCENPDKISFSQSSLLAGLAGIISSTLSNPFSISKLRIQVQQIESKNSFRYKNIFHGVYLIHTQEGFLAHFKGLSAKILTNTPQKSISISITEYFRQILLNNQYKNIQN
ncbi:mitochondrial carrier protein, putative [Ichthyophthirius multifiliis]|uniref:Mitochondrial carrier protein, putative n=1 Tax=Ichthyophthirius multifiliis TaxID=5932 RepID=G0R0T2_ICHMU|nr:mitochondrial carrier protein, putative [Ichthyophthirius multifiliis]EGR28927.1 mitochondrial carrier protein, putative [Ichthyophthirius multifiliis]|eukprot:XP_004030163.1 mitochondrial carrier protein, putative [Ichthyophthirius multifiliis]